jgi:uncharacterized protein
MNLRCIGALLLLLLATVPAQAEDLHFPVLSGRVVDEVGILSADQRTRLESQLAQHEAATSNQIVVVTLKSLQGDDIADYGYRLGRAWGIGQKGRDNGVLVIVAPNEHRARIEVGYGLEGALPDVIADEILRNRMLPRFRANDYPGGIEAGVSAIMAAVAGAYTPLRGAGATRDQPPPPWFLLLPFGFLLLIVLLSLRYERNVVRRSPTGPWGRRGGIGGGPIIYPMGGGFGGGGFGGGGGFAGGGGSFGGGGASGRW